MNKEIKIRDSGIWAIVFFLGLIFMQIGYLAGVLKLILNVLQK